MITIKNLFMSNFTIKQRLYILIGVLITLFVFIGAFTILSFNKIDNINNAEVMAMEVEVHTLKLRKHEKDFLARELVNSKDRTSQCYYVHNGEGNNDTCYC